MVILPFLFLTYTKCITDSDSITKKHCYFSYHYITELDFDNSLNSTLRNDMGMLNDGDILLVTELSRLGRSTTEVITIVNSLAKRNIRVIVLKQNLDISQQDINSKVTLTLFSLFSELERDLISLRTKEALASKKRQGQILGKPKGTIQKSKFDKHAEKIKELLDYGLSVRKISSVLEYTNHIALNTYINKRNLKKKLQTT